MGVEPEDGIVSDDELKSLLERWVAPGPSRNLDKRIETSFTRGIFWCRQAVTVGAAPPQARRGGIDEVLFRM